jgi:glycosyltransferase involved in cell wall biosynthesis
VFPADWIVADPVVAAQRVLAFDDESWVRAGHAARDYVVANLDWSVVAPRYLEIFSDHR